MAKTKIEEKAPRNNAKIEFRLSADLYNEISQLAQMETAAGSKTVTISDLIREALEFYFCDNDRLREFFCRLREVTHKRWLTKVKRKVKCANKTKRKKKKRYHGKKIDLEVQKDT